MKLARCLGLIVACLALPAFAAPPSNSTDSDAVNWADDIAPLMFEKCVRCHRPGQTAPMSLLSYNEARPWAKSIRNVVTSRIMPPWFANPEHGAFVEDPTLSDAQIDIAESMGRSWCASW